MANPRGMKTWRRVSLSYTRDDRDRAAMEKDYKAWLCTAKGWFTEELECPKCRGYKTVMPDHGHKTYSQMRTWKKNRAKIGRPPYLTDDDRETCPTCDGKGVIAARTSIPDLPRAEAHISEQRERLELLARTAIKGVERRLREAGLRPVVTYYRPDTIAAYDAWAAEQATLERVLKGANDAAASAHAEMEAAYAAMDEVEKLEFLNREGRWTNRYLPQRLFEKIADYTRQQLWRNRVQHGYWYYPGDDKIVWAGTTKARNYHDAPKADAQIVLTPGRAPSEYELDMLVEQTLADLYPAPQLLAA